MKISYDPFWETLEAKNLNQYVLIKKLHVRHSLLHTLRHDLDMKTSTLLDLCEKLECNVENIIKVVDDDYVSHRKTGQKTKKDKNQ